MNNTNLIVLGLAGIALYFIVKNTTTTGAVNPANGPIPVKPDYWDSGTAFGSDAWSESINAGANARLQRQGSI